MCPSTHLDEGREASFSGLLLLLADTCLPSVIPNLLGRQEDKQGEKGGVTTAREGGPLYSSSQFKWRHEISSGEEDLETVLSEDGAEEARVGHGG